MKTGLVLEGGAMRALYSEGVFDVWMDEDIRIDGIVGVSAGACMSPNYYSKQKGRGLRYNKKYMGDPRNVGLRSLMTTGDIVNRDFGYYKMTFELDPFDEAEFERYGGEFYAVATNVDTGEAECLKITSITGQLEAIRASASMPFVSKFVEYEGKRYLDGGIADSIPVRACLNLGYDKNIVILTQPADYRKGPMNPRLIRACYRKHPKLCDALLRRHEAYNAQVEDVMQLEKEGRIFVIRPEASLNVKRLEKDPEELQRVYDRGVEDGKRTFAALKAYLQA